MHHIPRAIQNTWQAQQHDLYKWTYSTLTSQFWRYVTNSQIPATYHIPRAIQNTWQAQHNLCKWTYLTLTCQFWRYVTVKYRHYSRDVQPPLNGGWNLKLNGALKISHGRPDITIRPFWIIVLSFILYFCI